MFLAAFKSSRFFHATLLAGLIGVFATAAIADVSQLDQEPSPLTPEKIYLRSVRAMIEVPEPAFVTFRENVVGRNFTLRCSDDGIYVSLRHGDVRATYDVWFRTSDGSALSKTVSDANAKPCSGTLLAPAGKTISALGIAQASPLPGTSPAASPPDSNIGLPIIGAVRAYSARYYHIELAGLEKFGGNDVYHLKLTAYRDPDVLPLTDLFVDQKTFLVREARGEASRHFIIASGRVAGVVDFDYVGPYWLVKHEHFEAAANGLFVHARMTVDIDGSNFTTPNELTEVEFPAPRHAAPPKATTTPTRDQ